MLGLPFFTKTMYLKMSIRIRNTRWRKISFPLEKHAILVFLMAFFTVLYWQVNEGRKGTLTSHCQCSGERCHSTFQHLWRDENEMKPSDPDVTAVTYGEHICHEFQISFLKLECKNFGKGFCKERCTFKSLHCLLT